MNIKCEKCPSKISLTGLENYSENKHYLLCKKCLGETDVCSKSKCKKIFLLSDNDLKNTRFIYASNQYQFYVYDDVKNVVNNKYGSIENLQKIINANKIKKDQQIKKVELTKLDRETKLKELFQLNKLEYRNYGDCYSYVNYGEPKIEIVLNNELTKTRDINNRRMELANELHKINIQLDETLKSCYEYIHNLNTKDLHDTVRCIEIEHFLKYKTDYDKLRKSHSGSQAKDIALRKYAQENQLPKSVKQKYNKIRLEFE